MEDYEKFKKIHKSGPNIQTGFEKFEYEKISETLKNSILQRPYGKLFLMFFRKTVIFFWRFSKNRHFLPGFLKNRQIFSEQNFVGLIERISSSEEFDDFAAEENKAPLETELTALFKKIVSFETELDQPILDCGADSVVIVEFVDQVETKFAVSLEIEDDTTLRDIIGQLKSS